MEPNQSISLGQKVKNLFISFQSNRQLMIGSIVCLVLVFVFIFSAALFSRRKAPETTTTSTTPFADSSDTTLTPTVQKNTKSATLTLQLLGKNKTYRVGDDIGFVLIADTSGQTIRGYDAIFRFDKRKVSYTSIKNLFPTFQYQFRPRGDWIIITSEQKIDARTDVQFAQKVLMEFHFKALTSGVTYFPMSFVSGRLSDSNLIDLTGNDILTGVSGLQITISK